MPARDVEHGETSREANKLFGGDMRWLAESVAARAGSEPSVDSHVMRASDLRAVFSAQISTPGYWIDSTFSPSDVWDVPTSFFPRLRRYMLPCHDDVASGKPMRGEHMRAAFYNALNSELSVGGMDASYGGYAGSFQAVGTSFATIGSGMPHTPGRNDLYSRDVRESATYGFQVVGGTYVGAGLTPSNVSDWDVEAVFASFGFTVGSSAGLHACLPASGYAIENGVVSMPATAVRDLGMYGLRHYGWSEATKFGAALFYGFYVVQRVGENYRLSDLGWSWSPS